jgi:hypothetical protein
MQAESSIGTIQNETHMAKWCLYLSILGLGCLILPIMFPSFKTPVMFVLPLWLSSILLGVAGLIQIRRHRPYLTGKLKAVTGISLSVIPIILITYLFYDAFAGESYDDSNPMLVVNTIKKYCDYKFPQKILSLKAADRLAGGPDNNYTCVVSFITDHNGLTTLQDCLSKGDAWEDITDDLSVKDYYSSEYDPRPFASHKDSPVWYKTKIPQGRTHLSLFNGEIVLTTVCVELKDSNDVAVYIEGWGSPRIMHNRRENIDTDIRKMKD